MIFPNSTEWGVNFEDDVLETESTPDGVDKELDEFIEGIGNPHGYNEVGDY